MSWFLEYSADGGEATRVSIEEGQLLKIGRGSASDTKIPDPSLSRLHCELSVSVGVFKLRDSDSASGVFVGGKKISDYCIVPGESFRAGNTVFTIVGDSQLDAPTNPGFDRRSQGRHAALVKHLAEQPQLDRFRLDELINQDGNNLVYRATSQETGKTVAVKVLPDDASTEEDEARFLRAMRILQDIKDPSIATLYRAGRQTLFCWVAMKWYPEGSLRDRVEKLGIVGRLDWKDVWSVAVCISQSLLVLEREGIVHRNIRPTNILRSKNENRYLLSDLVVAKAQESSQSTMVTRQVFLPSELAYTAPERLLGNETATHTLQADIYSLGAVLAELLNGQPPFGRGDLRELLPRIRDGRIEVIRKGQLGMSELFIDLVGKMTEPDTARRIHSAGELWDEVRRVGRLSGLAVA